MYILLINKFKKRYAQKKTSCAYLLLRLDNKVSTTKKFSGKLFFLVLEYKRLYELGG